MKKLLLTGITAALFSIAAIAQEQETDQNQSNEFRETTEEMEQDAEETADSVSTDFQQGVNEVEQEAEEAGEDLEENAEQAGEDIEQGVERTGDEIEEGAEDVGNEIRQGAQEAGDEIEEGAEKTGDEIEQSTDRTLDDMNKDFKSGVDGENPQGANDYNTAPELEVVEGKEGPNNEVVYKYQDEFFYVDREEKKLVKAKESDLQDAEHEVIVNDPAENSDDANATSDNSEREKNRDQK